MTKEQLTQAKILAENLSLMHVNDDVLHGLYTKDFKWPVHTTVEVVARAMKDFRQFNGQWDSEALAEFCEVARKRIQII